MTINSRAKSRILESLILFCVCFGLDRLTKYWIFKTSGQMAITSWLSFDVTINRGIAWGMLHTASTLGFVLVTAVIAAIICALIWYAWQQLRRGKFAIEEMLILAGATSNLLDRLVYSGVIDFIHVHFGGWSFPIFNVADVFIVVGVVWILLSNYDQ